MTDPHADVAPAPRSAVLCAAWATPADVPERYRPRASDAEWVRYLMLASEILWMLSGRRFTGSGCTETAHFHSGCGCCLQPVDHGDGTVWYVPPALSMRSVLPWRPAHPKGIKLPRSYVTVTAVTVGGVAWDGWEYDHAAGILRRTDDCSWADCGTDIVVTYRYGVAPPEGGVQAAVALAVELALDGLNDDECRLPQRVQSVSRQGIDITMLDPQDFLEGGRVGIYLVDLWLKAVNPHGRSERARVWSPELPRSRRA